MMKAACVADDRAHQRIGHLIDELALRFPGKEAFQRVHEDIGAAAHRLFHRHAQRQRRIQQGESAIAI